MAGTRSCHCECLCGSAGCGGGGLQWDELPLSACMNCMSVFGGPKCYLYASNWNVCMPAAGKWIFTIADKDTLKV